MDYTLLHSFGRIQLCSLQIFRVIWQTHEMHKEFFSFEMFKAGDEDLSAKCCGASYLIKCNDWCVLMLLCLWYLRKKKIWIPSFLWDACYLFSACVCTYTLRGMNEWNLEPDMKGGRYMAKVKPAISSVCFFHLLLLFYNRYR